jgi:hypothetical protein
MSSNSPESELNLDLHFLPAWAQQSPTVNRYADYAGGGAEDARQGRGDRRDRPGPYDRRDPRERRGPRPEGQRRRDLPPTGGQRTEAGGAESLSWEADRTAPGRGDRREERREPLPPLPELEVNLIPDERGVESLARQIKLTGRAYPLFDIAYLILRRPDRYQPQFSVVRRPDGQPAQPLWVCSLDETLWLSDSEAVNHVLRKFFSTFYQTEKIPTEPPKGTYTFVAQCGLSGVILGPPNYHDYQNKLHKLHAERFSRMPFEVYKSRVKIVRDEAVVKQWLEEQSFKTEYLCLNVPEPLRFTSREEVEKHFRETHQPVIIKQVDSYAPPTLATLETLPRLVQILLRRVVEDQRRFPLRLVTLLSQQFAAHGLQFFKVNKSVTHVAVARPHYLDMTATPVSLNVRRIVEFINARPRCTRRLLLDALAPSSAPASPPASAGAGPEAQVAPTAEPPSVETPPANPEATAIIGDLHWLIHQGHVIEFANGILETAKPPLPRPVKLKPEPPTPPAATPAPAAPAQVSATPATEGEALADAGGTPQAGSSVLPPEPPPTAAPPTTPGEPAAETARPPGAEPSATPNPSETAQLSPV